MIERLIEQLTSDRARTRQRAAQVLGRERAPAAIGPLLNRLSLEQHRDARAAVLIALGKIGGLEALAALRTELQADGPYSTLAARSLALMGEAGIPALKDAVYGNSYAVQVRAAQALTRVLHPAAIPVWERVLSDHSRAAQHAAVEALADIGTPEAAAVLCQAMRNPWPRISRAARSALLRLCDPQTASGKRIPHLLGILEHGDTELRCAASRSLARVAELEPEPALRAALEPLARLAGFFSGEPSEARETYREARLRIKAVAQSHLELPLPATGPPPHRTDLPIPADLEAGAERQLPRPVASPVTGAETAATGPSRRPRRAE